MAYKNQHNRNFAAEIHRNKEKDFEIDLNIFFRDSCGRTSISQSIFEEKLQIIFLGLLLLLIPSRRWKNLGNVLLIMTKAMNLYAHFSINDQVKLIYFVSLVFLMNVLSILTLYEQFLVFF